RGSQKQGLEAAAADEQARAAIDVLALVVRGQRLQAEIADQRLSDAYLSDAEGFRFLQVALQHDAPAREHRLVESVEMDFELMRIHDHRLPEPADAVGVLRTDAAVAQQP